jgi:hypothetical protein
MDGMDGTNGTDGMDGTDGVDGTNGTDGMAGTDAPDRTLDICFLYSALPQLPRPDYCPAAPTYAIGDTGPGGGIVFHVTDGGLHGLEAAPADQGTAAQWGCTGTIIPGADGTSVGTGLQNTIDILAKCSDFGTAAQLADAYVLTTFDDWFLPSKDELELMVTQLHLNGVGGFDSDYYWSSSEIDLLDAWSQDFFIGPPAGSGRFNSYNVRAVRAF